MIVHLAWSFERTFGSIYLLQVLAEIGDLYGN
jgi:hypothetical protein